MKIRVLFILLVALFVMTSCGSKNENLNSETASPTETQEVEVKEEQKVYEEKGDAEFEPEFGSDLITTMTASEFTNLNIFLSNFSEAYFKNYEKGTTDAEDLLLFAYLHAVINSTGATFYESEYEGIYAAEVDRILKRFFGSTIRHETPQNSEMWMYEDGKFFFPAATGESYGQFSIATKMTKLADGNYEVLFNIYWDDTVLSGDCVSDRSVYALTADEASASSRFRSTGNGIAVLKEKMHDDKNTYEIVSYKTY